MVQENCRCDPSGYLVKRVVPHFSPVWPQDSLSEPKVKAAVTGWRKGRCGRIYCTAWCRVVGCKVRYVVKQIEGEMLRPLCPELADVFAGREPLQAFELSTKIVGFDKVGDIRS